MSENKHLSGTLAVVTGAGRGIGAAIAKICAERGAAVVITSRHADELEDVRAKLPSPAIHHIVPADLTNSEDRETLQRYVREQARTLPLSTLVLNAGAALNASVGDTSVEQWDHMFALNARAPFLLTKAFLPLLKKHGGLSRIIVVGSVVSTKAYIGQAAYTASKHALYGFTRVLAKELHQANSNVRVHSVQPGGVNTELVRSVRPDIDQTKLIAPEEIAAVVGTLLDMRANAVVDEVQVRRQTKEPWA